MLLLKPPSLPCQVLEAASVALEVLLLVKTQIVNRPVMDVSQIELQHLVGVGVILIRNVLGRRVHGVVHGERHARDALPVARAQEAAAGRLTFLLVLRGRLRLFLFPATSLLLPTAPFDI